MKSIIYKIFIILLSTTFICGFSSCGSHDHGEHDGHEDHDDHEDHEDHSGHDHEEKEDPKESKIVVLNQAQFNNAEIITGSLTMKNISGVVYASGYTRLDPRCQAEVNLPVQGTIKDIFVIEGDHVVKGQKLATLSSLEYNNILLEKYRVEEELISSEATLNFLQLEYDRQVVLSAENINSKKVLEKAKADLDAEKATKNSLEQQLNILNQTVSGIDKSGGSTITIRSPIEGFVAEMDIIIGKVIHSGEMMFTIIDNSQIHVDLMIYEKDLGKIEVGQKIRFVLTNQSDKEIEGEIYRIGKSFSNETKSVAVHADINKGNSNLIPGMYINALINIDEKEVETLPVDAIIKADGREFIFLLKKQSMESHDGHDHSDENHDDSEHLNERSFERIEVVTGAEALGSVQVTLLQKKLKSDRIVTHGAYYLQSHLMKSSGGGGGHGHAH